VKTIHLANGTSPVLIHCSFVPEREPAGCFPSLVELGSVLSKYDVKPNKKNVHRILTNLKRFLKGKIGMLFDPQNLLDSHRFVLP
jgi:hypothetical protein